MTETVAEPGVHAPGLRYRINTDHPNSAVLNTGTTVQIIRLDAGDLWVTQQVDENDVPSGREWYVSQRYLDPLPPVPEAFIPADMHHAQIERLEALLLERDARIEALTNRANEADATLRAERQTHRQYQDNVQHDQAILSECFGEAANDNDLCGVYDETVSNANSRMTVLHIDEREVEYTVTWTEAYEVRVTRSTTFTGHRRDQDGNSERASEAANECDALGERELIELLRDNGSHNYMDDSIDDVDWSESSD